MLPRAVRQLSNGPFEIRDVCTDAAAIVVARTVRSASSSERFKFATGTRGFKCRSFVIMSFIAHTKPKPFPDTPIFIRPSALMLIDNDVDDSELDLQHGSPSPHYIELRRNAFRMWLSKRTARTRPSKTLQVGVTAVAT